MALAKSISNAVDATTPILASASKIVFLMVATTICVSFLIDKLTQENFTYIAVSVFSYYFGKSQTAELPPPPPAPPLPLNEPAA